MQFLNDDSNEWMRKAAEDYPVKPHGMNWEAIASQLTEEAPGKDYAGYALMRYAAMVVFFMLLSLVCNKYLKMDFNNRYATNATSGKEPQHTAIAPTTSKAKESMKTNKSSTEVRDKYTPADPIDAIAEADPVKLLTGGHAIGQTNISDQRPTSFMSSVSGLERRMTSDAGKLSLSGPSTNSLVSKGLEEERGAVNELQEEAPKGYVSKRRLYAGLMFGPDISSVKFQKTEGVGFNLGLLLGYRLSPKWQLESGVLLNRKEYYSGGEYFNASGTYLPSHAYITDVDGYCTMFEIPLNVRYNISQKGQGNWFAVAGLSSYLMNKEDYNYTYKRYNIEYKGNKVYRNLSKEWLTVVNASIGYEKAISEKVQIRLEPYLKLPLRGMGTGKLPISSAGMNVGVSYPIK